MIDIISSNEQEKYEISEELMKKIESVIKECENEEEVFFDNEISITFTDNENIRQINNDYRQKDVETDVLSFPIYEKYELDEEKNIESDFIRPLGDIVISMEKADEQSKDFGHSFEREVCYLVCHSMFHLMGYDHIQEKNNA